MIILGWLSGWRYRKSHIINPVSGAGTNYQIRVKMHYGTGIDGGEDVYCNSKCKSDFGDIRFTDESGLLDYYMEKKVDSDYALFWVKIAGDLNTSTQKIYLYYGKDDEETISNGASTFPLFFVDFNNYADGPLQNQDGWVKGLGGWDNQTQIQSADVFEGAKAAKHFGVKYDHLKKAYSSPVTSTKVIYHFKTNIITSIYPMFRLMQAPNVNKAFTAVRAVGLFEYISGDWKTIASVSPNIWYRAESQFRYSDFHQRHRIGIDGTFTSWDTAFATWSSLSEFSLMTTTVKEEVFDVIFVAKFTDSGIEPSHGSWGEEEREPAGTGIARILEILDFF